MGKIFLRILLFFGFILVCTFWVLQSRPATAPDLLESRHFLEEVLTDESPDLLLPAPLRKSSSGSGKAVGLLDAAGVIALTNAERGKEAQGKLVENHLLRQAAEAKLLDMFTRQYFEHVSPDGRGPSDLAKAVGYQYLQVGENLAEGDFRSNQELLQGWMNSPGHRANILHGRYTEIGVAAGRGNFEGRMVWMAVQEFGRPQTDCPEVDAKLKADLQVLEARVATDQLALGKLKSSMEEFKASGRAQEYNDLVPQYNSLVVEINSLIGQAKNLAEAYNKQVRIFNTCIR